MTAYPVYRLHRKAGVIEATHVRGGAGPCNRTLPDDYFGAAKRHRVQPPAGYREF